MSEWIKVTDRLPPTDLYGYSRRVLIVDDCLGEQVVSMGQLVGKNNWRVIPNHLPDWLRPVITHWKPMPASPSREES